MPVQTIPITSPDQWLGLRSLDITASQIGALFGDDCHPHRTIASLYAEKRGLRIPGPDPESAVIRRGNALEPVVAAEVAKRRPDWSITKADYYLRDPDARIGATPDFAITGPRGRGILQTKTVGSGFFRRNWGDPDNPVPPFWIILQAATEMMLADAAYGAVAALVVGDYTWETHIVDIERHPWAEVRLRTAVAEFWSAFDRGAPPMLNPKRDADLVRVMYPTAVSGKVLDLRGDNRIQALLEEREVAAGIAKEAEERKKAAEVEIKEKLGDAECALVPGWRLTLRNEPRREHVVKASNPRVLRCSRNEAA